MNVKKHDADKQRQWQRTIAEAARSGLSVREFCRRHRLPESRFYWWRRRIKTTGPDWKKLNVNRGGASFSLVSEEGAGQLTGLELVLRDGRRLRINQGVEEQTLRSVLSALEPSGNE